MFYYTPLHFVTLMCVKPENNPYAPGAGRNPPALVGRQKELDDWSVNVRRITAGRDAQSIVLYGLRGVGKTVLLTRFARTATRAGWTVAQIEARAGKALRQLVGDEYHQQLADIARPGAGQRAARAIKTLFSFMNVSVDATGTWTFGLNIQDAAGGGADTGFIEADLVRVLRDLAGAAEEHGTGVALLVDEAQDLTTAELAALCEAQHRAGQQQERLLIVLAGLPSLPKKLADAKSYAERLFDYHEIGTLNREESADALTEPAKKENVEWSNEAINLVLDGAGGYPYFLQQFGNDTWKAAGSSPITVADARVGLASGRAALDAGFFRSRWDRATPAERDYVRAMAEDGALDSSVGDVAARQGMIVMSLGPTRRSLINKNLIYASKHGRVAFTVPAMAEFVNRQID